MDRTGKHPFFDAAIPMAIRAAHAFGYFSHAMGAPAPVLSEGGEGEGVSPPVTFHWFSDVSIDADFDASYGAVPAPSCWAVTMEIDGEGAAEVGIRVRNADDLLNRLVGFCTLNGVPYEIEGPEPAPATG